MSGKTKPGKRRGPLVTMLVAPVLAMVLAVSPAVALAQGVEEAPAYDPAAAPCYNEEGNPQDCGYPIDPGPEPPTGSYNPPPEPPTNYQYAPPYGYCQYEPCGPPGYGGWEMEDGDKIGEDADRAINVGSGNGSGKDDYAAALRAAHSANEGGDTANASEIAGDDGGEATKDGGPKEETVAAEEEETVATKEEETAAAEGTEPRAAEAGDARGEVSDAATVVPAREVSETDGGSSFPVLPVVFLGAGLVSLAATGLLLGRIVR